MTWVILSGTLMDGIEVYGPFESEDDAILWATKHDVTSNYEFPIGNWEQMACKELLCE